MPAKGWYHFQTNTYFELGQSIEISRSCNPNFEARVSCEDVKYGINLCNDLRVLLAWGKYNANDHFETYLQCPQCGCGAEGAVNINDLYAG